jgi:hypothetical protein
LVSPLFRLTQGFIHYLEQAGSHKVSEFLKFLKEINRWSHSETLIIMPSDIVKSFAVLKGEDQPVILALAFP